MNKLMLLCIDLFRYTIFFATVRGSFPVSSDFIILCTFNSPKKKLYSFLDNFIQITYIDWESLNYLNEWLEFENNACICHNCFIFNFPTPSLMNIIPSFPRDSAQQCAPKTRDMWNSLPTRSWEKHMRLCFSLYCN